MFCSNLNSVFLHLVISIFNDLHLKAILTLKAHTGIYYFFTLFRISVRIISISTISFSNHKVNTTSLFRLHLFFGRITVCLLRICPCFYRKIEHYIVRKLTKPNFSQLIFSNYLCFENYKEMKFQNRLFFPLFPKFAPALSYLFV